MVECDSHHLTVVVVDFLVNSSQTNTYNNTLIKYTHSYTIKNTTTPHGGWWRQKGYKWRQPPWLAVMVGLLLSGDTKHPIHTYNKLTMLRILPSAYIYETHSQTEATTHNPNPNGGRKTVGTVDDATVEKGGGWVVTSNRLWNREVASENDSGSWLYTTSPAAGAIGVASDGEVVSGGMAALRLHWQPNSDGSDDSGILVVLQLQ